MELLDRGHTRLIISVGKEAGLLRNQLANVLAQCRWEVGDAMQPVRETFATSDAQAKARLTAAWKSGKLTWVKSDYWSSGFFGRGFIQLTHRENYAKASRAIGVDLVANPSLALEPSVSARIAVVGMRDGWFTGKKLSDYITLSSSNFLGARAIVNGDKNKTPRGSKETIGQIIARYSRSYDEALKAEGYGVDQATVAEPPKPVPGPPLKPAIEVGFLAALWAAFVALFSTKGA